MKRETKDTKDKAKGKSWAPHHPTNETTALKSGVYTDLQTLPP